ncbi:MAG: TetR family transcriptional regulator C-terminal domain-containing protein, partial [Propionibacteriaceae bacterium]
MSKSGLYAHFDSKQDLQLAKITAAEELYNNEVVAPALQTPEGIERLQALCVGYLSYVERGVFPGGCFFAST